MLKAQVLSVKIDTYKEAEKEQLPMFAENRVHQRTSGNPYPNKIVLEAFRGAKEKEEHTVIKVENDFIEFAVLPELGGKIWYAYDKRKGYNFIYKNNVIKPALIGVLGSWTSGGMEFNWPFHHRASTFMPVDYYIEKKKGEITVFLSEHDPIDRMKGMVGISLKENECIFETRVKLDNITDRRRSFLWWENTAVPVNENYEIFFPEDVNYVRFHYKRSVTTYPVANNEKFGAFNGIYYNGDTDISRHANTKKATSYFSADSRFDYFGGYDAGVKGGIVHIADHHISPGKKMFTWAYSQLAKTWENALTDTDGQYAELMAGCYSDNQPDFSFLMPNETKEFVQRWYPIHDCGKPCFANENFAVFNGDKLSLQSVRRVKGAEVTVNGVSLGKIDFPCYDTVLFDRVLQKGDTLLITVGGKKAAEYTYGLKYDREIPSPRKEYPYFKDIESAEELYKLGLHAEQYRSPEYRGEVCFKEALLRDEKHTPSMIALAEIYYGRYMFGEALSYIDKAEKICTEYNTRLESGRLYYVKALIKEALGNTDEAYDYYYKSYFTNDYKCQALFKLSLLDIKAGDIEKAVAHITECVSLNTKSVRANALSGFVLYLSGDKKAAVKQLDLSIEADRLNLFAHFFKALIKKDVKPLCAMIKTDITQDLLDFIEILYTAGLKSEVVYIISEIGKYAPLGAMPEYIKDHLCGDDTREHTKEGIAFPSRIFEKEILEEICERAPENFYAHYLCGCLYYGKTNYEKGLEYFIKADKLKKDHRVLRNLSVAYYSHFGDVKKALKYFNEAFGLSDKNEKQMTFEYAYLAAKTGEDPQNIINTLKDRNIDRDELYVELARAYNHNGEPQKAIDTLLSRSFVACEGGEHYIADQYMYAFYLLGKAEYEKGDYEKAIEYFSGALTLPQSLGSGLWNDIKKTPYLYFSAKCYDKLGNAEKAKEVMQSICTYDFDYFTNMYFYCYRYYKAAAYRYLGNAAEADKLIDEGIAADLLEIGKESMGYFGTTPFFISFIDDNKSAREQYFSYRLYLYYSYKNDTENAEKYKAIFSADKYGMYIYDFT